MKKLTVFLILMLLAVFTMGNRCTDQAWKVDNWLPRPKDSICNTIPEGESFICQKVQNPRFIHSALYIANAAWLDNATPEQIDKEREIVNEIIWYLDQPSITYAMFYKHVLEKQNSLLVLAAAQELSMFEFEETPIFEADRDMMKWSLNQTLSLLDLAVGFSTQKKEASK